MIKPHVSFDPRRVGEIARTFVNGVIILQNSCKLDEYTTNKRAETRN